MKRKEILENALALISTCKSEEKKLTVLSNFLYLIKSLNIREKAIIPNGRECYLAVDQQDLLMVKAKGRCSELSYFDDNKINKFGFSKSLGQMQSLMKNYGLIRVHHSYLVNLWSIKLYHVKDGQLELTNGEVVPVSRAYKKYMTIYLSTAYL